MRGTREHRTMKALLRRCDQESTQMQQNTLGSGNVMCRQEPARDSVLRMQLCAHR